MDFQSKSNEFFTQQDIPGNKLVSVVVPARIQKVQAVLPQKPVEEIQLEKLKLNQLSDLAKTVQQITISEKPVAHRDMPFASHECTDCNGDNPCDDCDDQSIPLGMTYEQHMNNLYPNGWNTGVVGPRPQVWNGEVLDKEKALAEAEKAKRKKLFIWGGVALAALLIAITFIVKSKTKKK